MLKKIIEAAWKGDTLEALKNFIRIPAKNRSFDSAWETNGYLDQAIEEAIEWGRHHFPLGRFEVLTRPGFTPVLNIDLPATDGHTGRPVFFYGHFDKQPESEGWSDGLGPWEPVLRNGRLYGRGASDDGYSFYLALTAVRSLEKAGIAHPRIVGLFETDEEAGSNGLADYLKDVAPGMGDPAFLTILDLSIRDYKRLWHTQSLRGVVSFELRVDVLSRPVHSGAASGLVPSSFDVLRQLLDRLSDPTTGKLRIPECFPDYPKDHDRAISDLAELLGDELLTGYRYVGATQPRTREPKEAIIRTSWEPSLSYLAASGFPPLSEASALIRPHTSLLLSLRIPPRVDSHQAFEAIRRTLTTDIPSGAKVSLRNVRIENGFDAPSMTPWLRSAWEEASAEIFGERPMVLFEGASIGTLGHFARTFPNSPFLNTGVLGPEENAHAPDESILLDYAVKLTEAIARTVASVPKE